MTNALVLEPRLDTAAAKDLSKSLERLSGPNLTLDGSHVQMLGGRCLEVLLDFRHTCQTTGSQVSVISPSPALVDDLRTFGLEPDDFRSGVSA